MRKSLTKRNGQLRTSGVLFVLLTTLRAAGTGSGQTLTVLQTASTNLGEIKVTINTQGSAIVKLSDGSVRWTMRYSRRERERLWAAVLSAGPLTALPVSHCLKSASFGSKLFIEVDGRRSADLSCPNQSDPRTAAQQTEARMLLQSGRVRARRGTEQRSEP